MDWFEFTDLPQLQSVELGWEAFRDVHSIVFESDRMDGIDDSDLHKLQSIHLGHEALDGDWRDDRETIRNEPFNFKNTLTMRSEIK